MIPQTTAYTFAETAEQPTRTYALDFAGGRAVGMTDGLEAMKQAIFLILNTERFRHLIFSWSYGHELKSAYGKETDVAKSEVKRLITEALLQDERITAVDDFSFENPARSELAVSFTVTTVFGSINERLSYEL